MQRRLEARPGTHMSDEDYEHLALAERHAHWELHDGRRVGKPGMTSWHADVIEGLFRQLHPQLPDSEYAIRADAGRLRRGTGSYFEADLSVVPRGFVREQRRDRADQLEVYDRPIPLVDEVWSRSTGQYDVNTKILEYQRRGDLEIWRIGTRRRPALTAWRRRPDWSYSETIYTGGTVSPVALPGVTVDLDILFAGP